MKNFDETWKSDNGNLQVVNFNIIAHLSNPPPPKKPHQIYIRNNIVSIVLTIARKKVTDA